MVSFIVASLMTLQVIEKFEQNSIITSRSVETIDITNIPFPAFTYCSDRNSVVQPINYTYAQQLARSTLDAEKLEKL